MFTGLVLDYHNNIGDGFYHHHIVDFWIFTIVVFGFQSQF